jgi:two-component system CheB/CheR fusion protein
MTNKEKSKTKAGENTHARFPIVGIGASAGGLAAFEAFFSGMPANTDPGMAFVLVQHLAPDHKSMLTELIRRYTRMQVFEVEDGMTVRPNCAYIIPPNRDMAFLNGTLQLLEPTAPHGQRMPIDFFFRSLALDQHEHSICIVLSGTGSDCTLGLRSIKGEGGMAMAQNPSSTEYDGMPCSALATGLVDYELPPAEMPAQLIAYVTHSFGKPPRLGALSPSKTENATKKIFILLRTQTGHDFSQYKPSTVNRRIERRMAVHQIDSIDEYVKFLQTKQSELDALFRDLLIGVTSFFRDPEVFKALESQVIPKLFLNKAAGSVIRVWSPGCSTGEEAYSIAILLQERLEALKQSFRIQVFATDIDSQAITVARNGLYPASIAVDISPDRLARFFVAEPDGNAYRIHKGIRDMLIVSEQDVIKDPPFSKLDLISCRNLLIYMGADLQKKLIPLFHYALNPTGFLLLGTSETIGEFNDLFSPLDAKSKLYRRKEILPSAPRTALSTLQTPGAAISLRPTDKKPAGKKLSLRELTEQALLQQVSPTGALVNSQGDILYFHGRTGLYLEPAPGEAGVNNILKMARDGLQLAMTSALHKAVSGKQPVQCPNLRVKNNGHYTTVTMNIRPVMDESATTPDARLYLISLEEVAPISPKPGPATSASQAATDGKSIPGEVPAGMDANGFGGLSADEYITALKQELRAKEEFLQSANEELETSNEELKCSNEELQSVNEELQSTNEELETSKEELQSINEELATVNTELQTKVLELTRNNNDMSNLLAGTCLATIFVDHNLRVLRFTPAATQIINLIQSDVGRPVSHIVSNLTGYDRLVADTQAVLDTLVPKEMEVLSSDGKWYNMRIRPYRTLTNVIEGAVITFADISATKEALKNAESFRRLAVVMIDAYDAITVQSLDGRILAWNPAATRLYGWSEAEALAMTLHDMVPEHHHEEVLALVKRLSHAEVVEPCRSQRLTKDGRTLTVMITATALVTDAGETYGIATTERAVDGLNEGLKE